MLNEHKLEQHYNSIPTEMLKIIRDEYQWALDEGNIHNDEQVKYIDRLLIMRGENPTVRATRKILFLCKCGQSRIVTTNTPEDRIKMFIFEQYNVSCPKCHNINQYSWKYMD